MGMKALDEASIEPTGYESLGDEQAVELGTVGYAQLPQMQENGGTETCLVVSPITGDKLTSKHKLRLLEEAAKIVGGDIEKVIAEVDKDTKKRWAQFYVHKSKRSRFSRYLNCAESHRPLEDQVSYVLDTSSGPVLERLFSIID